MHYIIMSKTNIIKQFHRLTLQNKTRKHSFKNGLKLAFLSMKQSFVNHSNNLQICKSLAKDRFDIHLFTIFFHLRCVHNCRVCFCVKPSIFDEIEMIFLSVESVTRPLTLWCSQEVQNPAESVIETFVSSSLSSKI